MRVALISEDSTSRETLRLLLQHSEARVAVVGEYRSPDDAFQRLAGRAPAIAVVELRRGARDGLASVAAIRQRWPGARVVLLLACSRGVSREQAIHSGVSAVLVKPFSRAALELAIACLARGLFACSSALAGALSEDGRSHREAFIRASRLNPRKVATLDLLARFLSNKEIADRLGLSVPVAEKVLRTVNEKLGSRTRAEAIVIWNAVAV